MISETKPIRVSVAMVMDGLKEQCDTVDSLRKALQAAIDSRNEMMVELKAAGIPERNLCRLTRLSRDSVAKITANARRTPAALDLETRLRASDH